MLLQFSVSNFKSFNNEQTLSFVTHKGMAKNSLPQNYFSTNLNFNVLKSLVLFGANASGKSNLIKSLAWFKGFVIESFQLASSTQQIQYEEFALNYANTRQPARFKLNFVIDEKEYIYEFNITRNAVIFEELRKVTNKRTRGEDKIFSRGEANNKPVVTNVSNPQHIQASKILKDNVLFLSVLGAIGDSLAERIITKISNIEFINGIGFNDTLNYSIDNFTKYQNQVLEMMRQADFGINNMHVTSEEIEKAQFLNSQNHLPLEIKEILKKADGKLKSNVLATTHRGLDENNQEIDINFNLASESTGTQQMFAVSAPIINSLAEGKTLVIDELDAHLHPYLCRFVILKFHLENPNNAQLLFTSHSSSLMDNDLLRRDQIWFAEKNNLGESRLYSLASLGEKEGLDYQKRYLDGRYGGLPYISLVEEYEDEYAV